MPMAGAFGRRMGPNGDASDGISGIHRWWRWSGTLPSIVMIIIWKLSLRHGLRHRVHCYIVLLAQKGGSLSPAYNFLGSFTEAPKDYLSIPNPLNLTPHNLTIHEFHIVCRFFLFYTYYFTYSPYTRNPIECKINTGKHPLWNCENWLRIKC